MEPLTMREAFKLLNEIGADIEHIIASMNQNEQSQGGFEKHMFDLRHHVSDAASLLDARIAGQLRPANHIPEYDKPLNRC